MVQPALTEDMQKEITARQNGECQTYDPTVCTHGIDLYAYAYPIKQLRVMRRDPNSVDNLLGLCLPCAEVKDRRDLSASMALTPKERAILQRLRTKYGNPT